MELNKTPLVRIFNWDTGKYELIIDELYMDVYGKLNKVNHSIEWFTGICDKNNIPLYENDLLLPIIGNNRQYKRIWKTTGGFVLSSLSMIDKERCDYLVNQSVQNYISNYCEKVGCTILNPDKLKGRSKEEMIKDLVYGKKY